MFLRLGRFVMAVFLVLPGCTIDFSVTNSVQSTADEQTSDKNQDSDTDKNQDSDTNKNQDSNTDKTQDSEDSKDSAQDSETTQANDACPDDPNKTQPGVCGCGVPDSDQDGDGTPDCNDNCPTDPNKTQPGFCGCGQLDRDCDGNGSIDCGEDCTTESVATSSVSSSHDDAEEAVIGNSSFAVGHVELDSSDLEMTNDAEYHGSDQIIGLRFPNLQVPKNAVIQDAYVEFVADASNSESTSLSISVMAADNAPSFSATSFDLSTRTEVTSVIPWNNIAAWNVDSKYKTPNLAAALQEVVNRGGWVSGNAVVLLVRGTGIREAVSYDQTPKDAATLHVTYH